MKKFLFLAAALVALAAPAANAQRVNTKSELKKLDKADATLLDEKKNIKAATWNAHGKAYTDAYMLPTKELAQNIPMVTLQINVGEPLEVIQDMFQGQPVIVARYEYVDVYIDQLGMICGWNQSKSIKENLAETAIDSYKKAYELDNKLASKISANTITLAQALAEQGRALNAVGRFAEAANNFELAYRAQQVVPTTTADLANIYNAGYINVMLASTATEGQAELYAKAEKQLTEAIEGGYKDDGQVYYYLFYCYYGQKSIDTEKYLALAKETLVNGIKLYPKNADILNALMSFYTSEQGVGDPAELVTMVENMLNADPTNYDLWFGRGRVFNALKNYDECITSFKKCAELRPEDYDANYYVGLFITMKADDLYNTLNSSYNVNANYEAETEKINRVYAEAIPWFERALEIKPNDASSINMLAQLCFRLRDMDGMAEKHAKYKAMKDAL